MQPLLEKQEMESEMESPTETPLGRSATTVPWPAASVQADSASVLELRVANHAGTMSHICGLFSRRAFNLDGILCLPVGDGATARLWLRVIEEARLPQLVRQLRKLEDVVSVNVLADGAGLFRDLATEHLGKGEALA